MDRPEREPVRIDRLLDAVLDNHGIQPLETVYDGHRFRSRLEARYALFFNTLRIPYEYEPEGYDLDGVRYLCDFWMPTWRSWVEIKPYPPTATEQNKMRRLVAASNKQGFIVYGTFPFQPRKTEQLPTAIMFSPPMGCQDEPGYFCECSDCHQFGIVFYTELFDSDQSAVSGLGIVRHGDKCKIQNATYAGKVDFAIGSRKVFDAYHVARFERFV